MEVVPLGKRQFNPRAYVARFNFSGSDQQKKVSILSGGERNRVHLSRMLSKQDIEFDGDLSLHTLW